VGMTSTDRTFEFTALAENVRSKKYGTKSNGTVVPRRPPSNSNEKSRFTLLATQIGKDLTQTTEKLERLTNLAKNWRLYDDPAVEIQELTGIINQDIKNLNHQIELLQQLKNGRNNKHSEINSNAIVNSLKSKLKNTAKDFSVVLEVRTENLKKQQKERERYTGGQTPTFGKRAAQSPLYRVPSVNEESNITPQNGEVAIMMPLVTQETYISHRAEAVQTIQITMAELQGIFSQLAHLVAEQGETLERIDHDVESAEGNIVHVQEQLLKYLRSIGSNRWLIFKLFLILVLFIIIFVVFFV